MFLTHCLRAVCVALSVSLTYRPRDAIKTDRLNMLDIPGENRALTVTVGLFSSACMDLISEEIRFTQT